MSNVKYRFSEDGLVAYGELASGQIFVIDADMVEKIRIVKFYLGSKGEVLQTQEPEPDHQVAEKSPLRQRRI